MNYYNDNDLYCAYWLRNLIAEKHLPEGTVDETNIQLVDWDLSRYRQVHLFAGIGGWPLALQMAGWPEDLPVWTGSCPCQPFSCAGKRKGTKDERHLWPCFRALVDKHQPPIIFGEQVASPAGREWLSGVRTDLEALGYAVGAADLCAAGVGAPHIRQRLWWMAHNKRHRWKQSTETVRKRESIPAGNGENGRLGNSPSKQMGNTRQSWGQSDTNGGLEYPSGNGRQPWGTKSEGRSTSSGRSQGWNDFDLIPCADGKQRRIEPGTFPLAHGIPQRVGKLRAYGNAIVPQVAAEFIKAVMGVIS